MLTRRYEIGLAALIVAGFILLSVMMQWRQITALYFFDPDDSLRLVQVRDLLAGQSWFDVTQYRMNPPYGGLMHWSRLVDMPIAAIILAMEPIFGRAIAEQIAVTVWPMTMTALIAAMLFKIAALFHRPWLAPLCVLLYCLCGFVTIQSSVGRIDHHDVQMLLALTALYCCLRDTGNRSAFWAGLLLALQASISIEGLAFVPIFGLLYIWPWLQRGENSTQLAAFLGSFSLVTLVTLLVTRGFGPLVTPYCDAVSAPYVAAAFTGTAILTFAIIAGRDTRIFRYGALCIAGASAALVLALLGPECLSGPFGSLDPLVRHYWYDNVLEGLPVTRQPAEIIVYQLIAIILGLGALWVVRARARDDAQKQRGSRLFIVTLLTILLSLAVSRVAAFAQLFMIPATACLLLDIVAQSRTRDNVMARFGGIALALLLAWPISASYGAALAKAITPDNPRTLRAKTFGQLGCVNPAAVRTLAGIAPATIFTPLDIGPDMLEKTGHSVIASGHHRNADAMRRVITAFTGTAAQAEPIVRASGARLLAICPFANDVQNFVEGAGPHSFAATLPVTTPDWLCPVSIAGKSQLLLYRVKPVNGTCPNQ